MKAKSNQNKNNKIKESQNKQSSKIMDDITNDYNNIKDINNNNDIFKWRTLEETVICKAYNDFKPGKKILSFDLDDTITSFEKKKSGKSKSPDKDKQKVKDNSYIYTFGINKIKSKLDEFAKEKDYYRKPCPGMIELFKKYFNENMELDLKECIYVGDAAGRKKSNTYKRNDFSDSDYKFAINCQFKFFTPEEFFLNEKSEYPKITNKMHDYDHNNNDHIKYDLSPNNKEVIILIGSPGSGKSTFTEKFLLPKGYIRINQDILKTKEKVLKSLLQNIKEGKKIVIDSTNPQKNGRKDYIKICKENNYSVRAFVFQVSKELAFHLNNLRAINKNRNHYSGHVNNIPIHAFFKNFEQPEINEGFKEIVNVNFVPGPFENEEDKKIFYYLS